jgi:hypothetical protein
MDDDAHMLLAIKNKGKQKKKGKERHTTSQPPS